MWPALPPSPKAASERCVTGVTSRRTGARYAGLVIHTEGLLMSANVGGFDRSARIVVGLALLALTLVVDGPERWWGLVGLLPLLTGLLRWCPAYTLFGWNTCPLTTRE